MFEQPRFPSVDYSLMVGVAVFASLLAADLSLLELLSKPRRMRLATL
jgi:hypothetical protein